MSRLKNGGQTFINGSIKERQHHLGNPKIKKKTLYVAIEEFVYHTPEKNNVHKGPLIQ